MNCKKLFILVLLLGIVLFALSGCTAILAFAGYSYFFGDGAPTEPTEPTVPELAAPQPAFKELTL